MPSPNSANFGVLHRAALMCRAPCTRVLHGGDLPVDCLEAPTSHLSNDDSVLECCIVIVELLLLEEG